MTWLKRSKDNKLTQRLERISVGRLRADREAEQRAAVSEAERLLRLTRAT